MWEKEIDLLIVLMMAATGVEMSLAMSHKVQWSRSDWYFRGQGARGQEGKY